MGSYKKYKNTKKGHAAHLLCGYRKQDRKNGFGNVIDFDAQWMVDNILLKPCAHCGETDWHKIGCNRLDNSKPHTMDNVEPCCRRCNISLGSIERNSIPIYQYTLDIKLIKIWDSMADAQRNNYDASAICRCCKGILKKHKGYIWSYEPLQPL